MPKCIYVADDDEHIRSLIDTFLANEGYSVEVFPNGSGLMEAFSRKEPDLIVLDIMMPGTDGLTLCSMIRKKSDVPIIIVSAKDSPMDRVTGITLGSDDYMVKPFLPLELTARVRALLRRSDITRTRVREEALSVLYCGNVSLDVRSRLVTAGDVPLMLTPTEFDFLRYLMERSNTAVSKKELLVEVWKCREAFSDGRMADDLVKRLRRKLVGADTGITIETVWGYGFRLTEKNGEVSG